MCLSHRHISEFFIDVNSNRVIFLHKLKQKWKVGVIRDVRKRTYFVVYEDGDSWGTITLKKKKGKFLPTDAWELYVQQYDL